MGTLLTVAFSDVETDDGSFILRFLDRVPTMYMFAHKAGIVPGTLVPSYSLTDAARSPE